MRSKGGLTDEGSCMRSIQIFKVCFKGGGGKIRWKLFPLKVESNSPKKSQCFFLIWMNKLSPKMHNPRTVLNPLVKFWVRVGLPWLCCMGCHGYVVLVAVVMLHGLPWLCCMGCRGYVGSVAIVVLHRLLMLFCMGCRGYVALPRESKVKPQVLPGWGVWQ